MQQGQTPLEYGVCPCRSMCAGFFVFQPDRLSIYTGFFVALNYLWAGPQFSVSRNHGGVYPPGYGPAFTVTVYLFSRA